MPANGDNVVLVKAAGLRKRYGQVEALGGVSFEIRRGEVFGLLGPNGAGKSTTIRMMVGLLRPTSGSVWVGGVDVKHVGMHDRASELIRVRAISDLQHPSLNVPAVLVEKPINIVPVHRRAALQAPVIADRL